MEPFVLQPNHLPALDHVPMGLCVLDEDLTVLVWNALLEEWTGISKKEILGRPIDEFFPHLGKKPYRGRLGQIFEGGTPTIFSSQLHKQFLPSKLPGYKDQVQHTTVTALPLEFADGYHALVAIRDVTETTNRIRSYSRLREEALKEIQERKRIEEELEKAGAKVEIKGNGRDAFDRAMEEWDGGRAFDLILMDMQMPVMDGYEATRLLREAGYEKPILALTAHAMRGDREKCIDAGCNAYASKPIQRKKLLAVVKELLEQQKNSENDNHPED